MAATGTPTPNIGLRRAQGTDPASVDDINYNSALIDTKLGAVGNSSVQDQIDTLNSNLAQKQNKFTYGTITGTTSTSGNISTNVSSGGKIVVACYSGWGMVVIPYINSSGNFAFHVTTPTLDPYVETSTTINYYYVNE